jgi:hypothetical protein
MFLNESHRKMFAFLEEGPAKRDRFDDRFECEGGGGGGGSQDMVSYTNLLPTYITGIQTWATEYLSAAMGMMISPGNFTAYPDLTYAAQNANELAGIAALALRGSAGADIEADGKTFLQDLYDGLKLNTNTKIAAFYAKKIEALLEEFDDSVMPIIQHQHIFSFGGSDHNVAEALASKMMMAKINEIAKMFYDDYIVERQLQHQGMAHATPYGLQCIRDGEMLRQAGAYAREYAQGSLQDAWDHYNEVQMLPIRNLDIAGNAVRTILSTSRSQTTQYHKPSNLSQIAGVAIAGLSIYSMFSGTSLNPYTKGAGVTAAGAEAGARAYSENNMGFDRSNPEMIGQ